MPELKCDDCIYLKIPIDMQPCKACREDVIERKTRWRGHELKPATPKEIGPNDFCSTCLFFMGDLNLCKDEGLCHRKTPAAAGPRLPSVDANQDWCGDYTPGKHNTIKEKKDTKCKGCENIRSASFPFEKRTGHYVIDTEGCGLADEHGFLNIRYCPVCGKKLEEETEHVQR